jgi:hypothetical protein
MTRIPSHSVADAPDASRALLQERIQLGYAGTEPDLPAGR